MRSFSHSTLQMLVLAGIACLGFAASARAQHASDRQSDDLHVQRVGSERTEEAEKSSFEDEHIFGFTEGADVGRKGEMELESTFTSRFGKVGQYNALENETALRYGIAEGVRTSLGLSADLHDINGVPGLSDTRAVNFNGFSSETRWQLLDRNKAPFGLTLSLDPQWRRVDDLSGERATTYDIPATLLIDTEILPNKLLAAANFTYAPALTRTSGSWDRTSALEVSAAISGAVRPDVFVGAELRYLSSYQGAFLNREDGQALFLGPSLFARLSGGFIIKGAWSIQVWGGNAAGATGPLNLVKFERNQVRAQIVKTF